MRKMSARATKGGSNVFADLGLPNPEQELLKARLTLQIYKIVKERGLTQALCFLAGANSIFYGPKLLTTPNPERGRDAALMDRLDLSPMVPF